MEKYSAESAYLSRYATLLVKIGKNSQEWSKKKLYDAVGEAEASVVYDAACTIRDSATKTRITKIQEKEALDKDGNIHMLTTITQEGPSLEAALKLVRFDKRWKKALSELRQDAEKEKHVDSENTTESYDPLKDLVEEEDE